MFPKSVVSADEGNHWFATTTAYAFAYALTALFIHRKFLSRRPPKLAGLLTPVICWPTLWAVAPSIVTVFTQPAFPWKSVEGLQLGNIFNVLSLRDEEQRVYHQYFAFGWLLVMLVINAKWFVRQAKNFRPPPASAPPVLE